MFLTLVKRIKNINNFLIKNVFHSFQEHVSQNIKIHEKFLVFILKIIFDKTIKTKFLHNKLIKHNINYFYFINAINVFVFEKKNNK